MRISDWSSDVCSSDLRQAVLTTLTTIAELRERLDQARAGGQRIGFVPTMGFLHAGHASLMDAARAGNDVVVTSLFVNPLQFAPNEDLDAYPPDISGATALPTDPGVAVLFAPTVPESYPGGRVRTNASVADGPDPPEGPPRPPHLAGAPPL